MIAAIAFHAAVLIVGFALGLGLVRLVSRALEDDA